MRAKQTAWALLRTTIDTGRWSVAGHINFFYIRALKYVGLSDLLQTNTQEMGTQAKSLRITSESIRSMIAGEGNINGEYTFVKLN